MLGVDFQHLKAKCALGPSPLYCCRYGGMSVREMEVLAIGLEETMDEEVISQGPQFIG